MGISKISFATKTKGKLVHNNLVFIRITHIYSWRQTENRDFVNERAGGGGGEGWIYKLFPPIFFGQPFIPFPFKFLLNVPFFSLYLHKRIYLYQNIQMQLWAIGFWAKVQRGWYFNGGFNHVFRKGGDYSPRGYCKRSWTCRRMSIKEIVFYFITITILL